MLQGVFKAYKKDNTKYYRASVTYQNKHISLGSFGEEKDANAAYNEARKVLYGEQQICDYDGAFHLDFKKWVVLINVRDNRLYIKTPIYLRENYFEYYLSQETVLKFDVDDLFYYSNQDEMACHCIWRYDFVYYGSDRLGWQSCDYYVAFEFFGILSFYEKLPQSFSQRISQKAGV